MDSDTSKDSFDASMPGMDMGSDEGENSAASDTVLVAAQAHSMRMAPQQKVVTERFEQDTEPETTTNAKYDHMNGLSSCVHGVCKQISVSASPPRLGHCQLVSLNHVAVRFSGVVRLSVTFYSTNFGSLPPRPLAADNLVTALRI
jgi:hypothetical protein